MATTQLQRVIRELVRSQGAGAEVTDGMLLESYVRTREEEAFAALVRRHGPMVWGVCRRMLGHEDAEDAFQATFLVLARKAAAVVPRAMVANWLYGVAHQTALKARANTARRGAREQQVVTMPEPAVQPEKLWDDVRPLLDLELRRLPDKYQAVIVLCDLEGKTRKEAARHFRVPEGTVASRLATARSLLAKRLSRHGLPVSAAALALVLPQTASGQMPLAIASTTIHAAILFAAGRHASLGATSAKAVTLAEGVLKTMLLSKLKLATAALVVVTALGLGVAALGQQRPDTAPAPSPTNQKNQERTPADKGAEQPAVEKKAEAPPMIVTGVVKAVDAGKKSLTVSHRDGETAFDVPDDAHINIDGKRSELAKLPVGAHVILSQIERPNTVRAIHAQGAAVFGSVKSVDSEKNNITVSTGQGGDKTYVISPNTEITIDGQGGQTLANIPKGANLHALNLCVDQRTAFNINVEGPSLHHVPVKSVDADRHTITFDDKAPGDVAGQTYTVAKDAVIVIDGQPGKLSGIPSGAFVNVALAVYGTTARRLDALGPQLCEVGISAVDVMASTITLDDKAPADFANKTLPVAKNANIVIDGKADTLASLPVGSSAGVILSVDRSTVRHLHVQGPSESGIVKGVNAEKSTIVIDDKTFAVAKDAGIAIDAKRGRLSELPEGAFVEVRLSMDRSMIRQLNAQGRSFQGALKAVDAVKNTMTIDTKTYSVAKDATILLDANPSTLASLPEGAFVGVTLSADQRTVRIIHAKSP